MEAKLVVVGGKANMGEVKLRLPMTIGRGHKADLMISHPTVSREHCRLSEKNGELLVHDNGSSNGTFVDGEKISKPTVVHPGQILAIGPLTFRAEYEGPTARVGKKSSGELAETQAIDKDELDLDFLLTDDEAPAAPAPKAKADKKTIEAKAPTAPAGKPSKNAAPAAKEKPKSAAPEKAPQAKSPAIVPPAGVSDTSDIDVDFLLDDLKEEQAQAPASRDTAEVDFGDLDFGEPEAKAEPDKKAPEAKGKQPEAAPPKKSDEPKQPEAFEQTVDFSSAGDLAEDFPGLIDDDTLPTEKNKAGADDFDFLSDLDDAPAAAEAAAPKFDIPEPESKKPEAKKPEVAPPEQSAPPLVDDDLDLDAFLGGLETKQPEDTAKSEDVVAKFEPAADEPAPQQEAAKSEPSPAAADATFDDFLADLDLDAGPKTEAAKEPEFGELEPPAEVAATPTADAEVAAKIRTSDEAAKEPEFDFSAFAETQELETIDAPPTTEAAEPTLAVGEVKDEPAAAGDAIAFDFLDEPKTEAVAPPTVEAPPEVKRPEAEVDFDFLAADVASEEVAEAPAAEQEFEATLKFDAIAPAAPVDESPKFDLEEPSEPQPEATPAEAAKAADDFDFLADLEVAAEAKSEVENPEATAPSEAEPFEATLNFDAVEPAPTAANDAASESPNFDFESVAPVAENSAVEKPATVAADEFDFLADIGAEPAAEASPPAEAAKAEVPAEKATAAAADEFDFLSGLEAEKPAESPKAEFDETAMFSVDAVGQTEAPSAETVAQEPKAEIEPSWDFDAVETPAPSAETPEAPQTEPTSVEAETAMFTAVDAPAEPAAEAAAPDFAAFDDAAAEPVQASEKPTESASPNFDVAASAAPAAKSVKPAAAKGPSFVEKLKMLFGGSKGAAKKAPAAKKAGKSGQAEPALPSKPMYQPVVPLPTAREEAPIPLDDMPIKLDDFAAEPATEMWSPAAGPSLGAPESTAGIDEFVVQDEFKIEVGPAASDSAPTGEVITPAKEESFDAFVAELETVAPATSTDEPIASTSADATSVDPLEADLLGEERQSLAGDAPQAADAAPTAKADADFMMDFAADELGALPTESSAGDMAAETSEASAADEFFNVDLGAAPAPSEEAAASAPADVFAPSEPTSSEAALPADIAAISPVAPASRRPQSIDIDLRTTSSLRPLARLNLQRPRIDTPEMQPEEPAGRSFAPRAKQTPPPVAPPETPIDVGASLTDDVPNDGAFAWDAPASDVPPGDMSMGDAPATDAPAAELGDADFDFFRKEQEAEAALDATAATPAEAEVAPSAEPAAEFDFLSDVTAVASPPEPQAEAGDDEFILMLDEVDAAAVEEPIADALPSTTTEAPAGDASAKAELDLDFLDLELSDAPAPDAANNLPPAAAKSDEAKPEQQPVASKKQASDDAELDDFLRDLGMN
ncbi:MAG: FHA domain-containing protein [Planctomycetales bacterium]|nr:FHA domain-containing protein [Planctomycetales bacterium]MBN8624389.1 FHA domain-containing protein [Planctomycetota bacterium]